MKFLKTLLPILFMSSLAYGAAKIQDSDIMSAAQLIGAGGNISQLPNSTKIYEPTLGIQLSTAITSGQIANSTVPFLMIQQATPANPAAGSDKCYVKADNKFYCLSSGGVESLIGPAGGGGAFPVSDAVFAVQNAIDATKQFVMNLVGATTGTTTTLNSSQTANRVVTLPDATDTLVGKSTTDTLINKSIDAATNTLTGITNTSIAAAGSANIARDKLASGTANHVLINDGAGVMSSEAQLAVSRGGTNHGNYTAGSVPFAGAGGTTLTEDNADFFWDNTLKRLGLGTSTPAATLDVLGRVNQSVSATDSGLSGLQFSVTTDTTVDGSNTTIGLQGVATATAQVGATNDKSVVAVLGTAQRGNGADDGVVHEMDGPYGILMNNSGAAGVTDKVIGTGFTLINQQGTITDLYDFRPDSVPAGGAVTNHYGLYVPNSPFGLIKNSWIGDRTTIGGTSYSAPTVELDVNGAARVRGLTTAGPVQTDVSGNLTSTATLPIASGGTNGATATAAFNNLSPLTTKGDILTHDGANNIRFAVCPDGQSMQADSAQVSGWKCVAPGSGGTNFPVTTYTADATITNAEYDVYLDPAAGTGTINITLFSAAGNSGHHINFVQISEGTININPVGGETIGFNGDTDAQMNTKGTLTIGSDGSNWYAL